MNRLMSLALALPAFAISAPVAARSLSADEHTALRCAVAFAQVAAAQSRGDAQARQYPPMVPRGREFFVRLTAQLIDDAGLDEAGVRAAAQSEAAALRKEGGPAGVMPFCLRMLAAQKL